MSTGTGCFIQIKTEHGFQVYLATNEHVLRGVAEINIKFSASRRTASYLESVPVAFALNGIPELLTINKEGYDVAVINVTPMVLRLNSENDVVVHTISTETFMDETKFPLVDAIEEVYMIGHPRGLMGDGHSPIVRRGITATPATSTLDGRRVFYLDAAVFEGSSGSPVLIMDKGGYVDKSGALVLGNDRLIFLGLFSHLILMSELTDEKLESLRYEENLSLGLVQSAQVVLETILQAAGENLG